jgi:hypothetical protein
MIVGGLFAAAMVTFIVIGILAALPWWGFITGMMVIGAIAIWILTIWDIWRRSDLSPVTAIIWTGAVIIFPLLGTIVYFFTRPPAAEVQYRGETVA